jgi:hypothetical protein
MKVTIALQEGFDQDDVEVRVEDKQVFRKSSLSTRLQLGLADSFEVEAGDRPVTVEVVVPSRGVRGAYTLEPAQTPHLGVSLEGGSLRFASQREPFGYV